MRLVALAPDSQGNIKAALQIKPSPGWITYWREPGDSGIPPQISVPSDAGVTLEKIAYPIPKLISDGEIADIGYDTAVTLPLDLKANGAPASTLKADVFIGLCKNICIPFQAELSLPLGAANAEDSGVIEAAQKTLPEPPGTDFDVEAYRLSPDNAVIHLTLRLPEGGAAPQIFVTGPSGYVFLKQQNARRSGTRYEADIAIGKLPKNYRISGKSWGLLVLNGTRAMETSLAFD
jgi:DsbC/DsbD-like thiol-disulfide interchange protein